MTDIKIKRLALENFKCHKSLTLNFDGGNASIYGDNASGKTSVYDALTWLLFGKDSRGNGEKNIEIKPLGADGNVLDHDALTSVEAVLDVNGEELTLRRTYREVWTTKRGSSEASYDGNTSEYFVDGVPCRKGTFQDKVGDLVDEDTFRLLTSVSYFADGISWQDRRAVLFKVAGVMADEQILASDSRFKPLVDSLGRLSLEDYKRKLVSEKKGFMVTKNELPARINECQKTIEDIECLDFVGAKMEVEKLTSKKEAVAAQIAAIENDRAAGEKKLQIREAELEMNSLDAENRAYRTSQSGGLLDVANLKQDLKELGKRLVDKRNAVSNEQEYINRLDASIEAARANWHSVNSEKFTGGICPACDQKLPPELYSKAEERFEATKKKNLDQVLQVANDAKAAKAQAEDRMKRMEAEIVELKESVQAKTKALENAEANLVEPMNMEGYEERRKEIWTRLDQLNEELWQMEQSTVEVKQKLRREEAELAAGIAEEMAVISKESLLEYSRRRIVELREDAKNASECLDAIEKMLYLIEEYTRYKTRFVEDSINGCFRIARFRLFREQANGGIEDRCDVVHDGVPYISVNNGMKINLGIDIINTLSTAYGVRVPLFVDNAESVTNLEKCGSQIIRLVVSENDKELRVNYEN